MIQLYQPDSFLWGFLRLGYICIANICRISFETIWEVTIAQSHVGKLSGAWGNHTRISFKGWLPTALVLSLIPPTVSSPLRSFLSLSDSLRWWAQEETQYVSVVVDSFSSLSVFFPFLSSFDFFFFPSLSFSVVSLIAVSVVVSSSVSSSPLSPSLVSHILCGVCRTSVCLISLSVVVSQWVVCVVSLCGGALILICTCVDTTYCMMYSLHCMYCDR